MNGQAHQTESQSGSRPITVRLGAIAKLARKFSGESGLALGDLGVAGVGLFLGFAAMQPHLGVALELKRHSKAPSLLGVYCVMSYVWFLRPAPADAGANA